MVEENPGDGVQARILMRVRLAVHPLQRADSEEAESLPERPIEEGRSTAPGVEEEDGWQSQSNVEDVLNRCGKERVVDSCGLHQIA